MTKLFSLNTAEWTFDKSMMARMQGVGEPYTAVCPAWLIDHPEGLVLFDTGVSYEMAENPADYGPYGAPHMEAFTGALEMTADDTVSAQLVELGYDPSEVDTVVLSHLHMDHAGDIASFPDAEFVVQQAELNYAFWPADPVQRMFYLLGDFGMLRSDAFDVTVIAGGYDVFGDGTLETIPTPGHTPGHQSLKVELDSGTVILGADVAHLMEGGYYGELMAVFNWDTEASIESLRKLKNVERRTDAEVYITHDADRFSELPEPPAALE